MGNGMEFWHSQTNDWSTWTGTTVGSRLAPTQMIHTGTMGEWISYAEVGTGCPSPEDLENNPIYDH
ncbi:hypothetical protein N7533_002114 [Penicillium manginii]|uniref:uncharacterized protein n=1 Tax=Penicillium manginii TaxID=203109 RepID=UPI0025499865|nr:uncharacterized protein N7533_002114 [Penicillium manginii]KAJ5763433.1 hypothetical protein N7533_002114 [Penicillium manginii]